MAVEQVSKTRFKGVSVFAQSAGNWTASGDPGSRPPVVKVFPYRSEAEDILRILHGSIQRYDEPTKPVAVEDWETFK